MRPTLETTMWRKTEGTGAKCEKAEKIPHRGEAGGEQGKFYYSTGHVPSTNPNCIYIQDGEPIPFPISKAVGLVKSECSCAH